MVKFRVRVRGLLLDIGVSVGVYGWDKGKGLGFELALCLMVSVRIRFRFTDSFFPWEEKANAPVPQEQLCNDPCRTKSSQSCASQQLFYGTSPWTWAILGVENQHLS